MRLKMILECVGEDGAESTTLGTIERLARSTSAESLGVNLQESKQIVNRLQDITAHHAIASSAIPHLKRGSGLAILSPWFFPVSYAYSYQRFRSAVRRVVPKTA